LDTQEIGVPASPIWGAGRAMTEQPSTAHAPPPSMFGLDSVISDWCPGGRTPDIGDQKVRCSITELDSAQAGSRRKLLRGLPPGARRPLASNRWERRRQDSEGHDRIICSWQY
jgi:hypothetical protein